MKNKSEIEKYKKRAQIAEHKYRIVLGQLIQIQHVVNRDSRHNTKMEFH